ncbi:MAG TPA: DUF6338 family protein [Longimicrobium sp.]|nr:DUF6338 family protein [Longimicrobium sp.]
MELSALTVRVVLLFFPGVLCALILHALTSHRDRTTAQFLTSAFVLGVCTYLALAGTRGACAWIARGAGWELPPEITFFKVLTDERARISWGEIAFSAILAALLALAVAAARNYNLLHRVAERLRISRQFGETDVWGHFMNSPEVRWISVRDLAADRVYQGWLDAFSDAGADPQLLLRDVEVYQNSTGAKLYDRKRVYLSPNKHAVAIEEA